MHMTIDSLQIKAVFKEAMSELIEERREEFAELLSEALADIALVHAIDAGRSEADASRDEIMVILDREPAAGGVVGGHEPSVSIRCRN